MNTSGGTALISIVMAGIAEVAKTCIDLIVPWRREKAQRFAKLEAAKLEAEIHKLNAETLAEHAKALRDQSAAADLSQAEWIRSQVNKNEAESALLNAQAEKARVEAEQERVAIRQSQIELALNIAERYVPDTEPVQKLECALRLLPLLRQRDQK